MHWQWLNLICAFFVSIVNSKNLRDVPVTKTSRVRWVAPEKWPQDMPSHTKAYWNNEFAKSTYEPACSNDQLKIVPIYFWPGERVDLPCAMCELAFVLNGEVKRWSVASDVTGFLRAPQENVIRDPKFWHKLVNNYEYQEDPNVAPPTKMDDKDPDFYPPDDFFPNSASQHRTTGKNEKKEAPIYFQREGKLSILRASPASQGVYFCHDVHSTGSTNMFYVVMAMVPAVSYGHYSTALSDGCGDKPLLSGLIHRRDAIFPSFNWRFHFLPAVRHETPEQCQDNRGTSMCNQNSYLKVKPDDSLVMDDENAECTLDGCRAKMTDKETGLELNVAIELRWGKWSSCNRGEPTMGREAHCYLVRETGKIIPDRTSNVLKWLTKLNSLFDLSPFRQDGLKIHSSLLPSLFMKVDKMRGCVPDSTKATLFDDSYRRFILSTVGVRADDGSHMKKDTEKTFKLQNAFQACFGYERNGEDEETLVGTYMVETRECP